MEMQAGNAGRQNSKGTQPALQAGTRSQGLMKWEIKQQYKQQLRQPKK